MGRLSKLDFLGLSEAAFVHAHQLDRYDFVHFENLMSIVDLAAAAGDTAAPGRALAYLREGLALEPNSPYLKQEYARRSAA
jgi:hypothetical protein